MKRLVFAFAALALTALALWTVPEPAFACSCATPTRYTTPTSGTGATCMAAKDDLFRKAEAMMFCSDACFLQLIVTSSGTDGCIQLADGTYQANGYMQYRCWTRDCYGY